MSTLTRAILPEIEIEKVGVEPTGGKGSEQDPEDPEAWEKEIGKAGIGVAYIFSDGSLLESGNVRGEAFIEESGVWRQCGTARLRAWPMASA